jgi:hypothetical protein
MINKLSLTHFFTNLLIKQKDSKIKYSAEEILKEGKIEDYPETFEELKELCKDITVDLKVCKDGTIYCKEHCIAKNRTPQQMWQIIKSLVEE